MKKSNKVLKDSLVYTGSALLIKALGFLLLPLYTNYLTPDQYGIINIANSFSAVMSLIITFSLHSAVIRFYTDYKEDKSKLKEFISSLICFVLIIGISITIIGFLCKNLISEYFFNGIEFFPIIILILLDMTFAALYIIHQNIMQAMRNSFKYSVINIIYFFSTLTLNITFTCIFKMGATGILLTTAIINILYFIFIIIDLKKIDMFTISMNFNLLKRSLRYSIPIIPHNLATRISFFISRLLLNKESSLAALGLYSVAYQFGNIIDVIQTSVNIAFTPWFYDVLNKNDDGLKKEAVKLSKTIIIGYSFFYLGIGLFCKEVIILMTNKEYRLAWTVVPILVSAFSIKSIYYFYLNIILFNTKSSKKVFIASITSSLSNIIFAETFVYRYGMYGVAIAQLLSIAILVFMTIQISKQCNYIKFKVKDMLSIIIPCNLYMGLVLIPSYILSPSKFSIKIFLFKVFMYIIYGGIIGFSKTTREIINGFNIFNVIKKRLNNVLERQW